MIVSQRFHAFRGRPGAELEAFVDMACNAILVVEDDEAIRETVSTLLEIEGYQVFTAENGLEALNLLKTTAVPCLILLDLMMPVMNGWEFLEQKNRNHVMAHLPVVVISAVANRENTKGADAIVRKPPDIDTLLDIVSQHCTPMADQQSLAA